MISVSKQTKATPADSNVFEVSPSYTSYLSNCESISFILVSIWLRFIPLYKSGFSNEQHEHIPLELFFFGSY